MKVNLSVVLSYLSLLALSSCASTDGVSTEQTFQIGRTSATSDHGGLTELEKGKKWIIEENQIVVKYDSINDQSILFSKRIREVDSQAVFRIANQLSDEFWQKKIDPDGPVYEWSGQAVWIIEQKKKGSSKKVTYSYNPVVLNDTVYAINALLPQEFRLDW